MGTNYYVRTDFCKECERFEKIHLGKSSAGWKFIVDVQELYYKTFQEFVEFIRKNDGNIYDEYNESISFDELMNKIESKKDGKSHCFIYEKDKYADCKEVDLHKGGFS